KNSENFEKYNFLKHFLPNEGKHMDVGGGLGVFCYGFKSFFPDWESICVEPTIGVDKIAKKYGVVSYNTYLAENSKKLVGKDFDLIIDEKICGPFDSEITFIGKKDEKELSPNELASLLDVITCA
ncbi:MAG: hypothetical protein VW667_11340, partial [Candidatus Neomarinimicrobiota bacterium]